jgi:hypothetical protein
MRVHFLSDVHKVLTILQAGGPAEYQSWWRGRRHNANTFFVVGCKNGRFLLVQERYGQYFELEDQLSSSHGGEASGILLVNFSVVSDIKIVHFSSDIGKISAILQAGGLAEPQSWWRVRRHTASKFFVVGGITIVHFFPAAGKISAIL